VSSKPPQPDRLVVMGRIVAPFGVKGWVRIQTFTATTGSLAGYPEWLVGRDGEWQECKVERAQPQGDGLAAKLAGLEDRDAALRLKGLQIAVPRAALPPTQSNEYYWTDLLGMQVVTVQGVSLGTVDQMMETGANDVMVVAGERERLIPFIGDVVNTVDLAARLITVDWDPEF